MSLKPRRARLRIWISSTELSPIGRSALGITWVNGRRRVPRPPASMTAFIDAGSDIPLTRTDMYPLIAGGQLHGPITFALEDGAVSNPPGIEYGEVQRVH